LGLAVLATTFSPGAASGQAVELNRTSDGRLLDLPDDGAWRVRAGAVARLRAALRAQGDFAALNASLRADGPTPAPAAVEGVMRVPAVMFGFSNTDTTALPRAAQYDSLYFGLTPPGGRSYSLRTLYREMSNDLLDVQGQALGWVLGDNAASYYLDACGTENAIDCSTGRARLWALWSGALADLDPGVDFGQFDNDGPDGVPNSGDDDGFVDVLQLVQPVVGGECGGTGVWAHRWFLSALSGTVFQTDDPAAVGGMVRINSYFIASGVGGVGPGNRAGCASPSQISGIGTTAHEFGHAIGLPDLYDGGGGTEGIGEWGLMGSGGYTSANSPAHLSAWSKERLGWVAVTPLTAAGTQTVPPVVSGDTIYLVRPPPGVANPRGEYFLLENKQAAGSDTANMLTGGNAGPKQGGLLVWHIDSLKITTGGNGVNFGAPHGVALEQADGLGHLDLTSGGNRGDGGDAYPGSTVQTAFTDATNPAARLNAGEAAAGIVIDSIRSVGTGAGIALRLRFGWLLVTKRGPGSIRSSPDLVDEVITAPGTVVTMVAEPDSDAFFLGWSGDTTLGRDTLTVMLTTARTFVTSAAFERFLVPSAPATQTVYMGANSTLTFSATGGSGTYTWVLLNGSLPPGMTLQTNGLVSGVPEVVGNYPLTARVMSGSQAKDVPVTIAVAAPALTTSAVLARLLGTGGSLTADEIRYLDLLGNRNGQYDVGDFRAFIDKTGGAVSAEVMAELLRKEGAR